MRAPSRPPIVAAIAVLVTGTGLARQSPVEIPIGPPVTIDGTIDDAEWQGARVESMTGGGSVFLRRTDRTLYVGIRGPADGIAHLCVASDNEVRLLHVSAAVGSAVYRRTGERFAKATDFDWHLRDPALTGPAADARAVYLEREGWVGTVSRMGPATEREIAILRRGWAAGPLRIAAGYLSTAGGAVARWPATATDCATAELVAGFLPDTAAFTPGRWADLR